MGKGVEAIRQETGFVKWNASSGPFTTSVATSMKSLNTPEALGTEGVCRGVGICGNLGMENREQR